MVSSTRQAIAGILLIVASVTYMQAQQSAPEKVATGSISGTVTSKGKAVAGMTVTATSTSFGGGSKARYRATTDQLGNYSITKLAPGNYEVAPVARLFVVEAQQPTRALLIGDGESVDNVDFALLRGGVMTGRVTDPEGQPLIEENIYLTALDNDNNSTYESFATDDRGIYRIFGLRPGKYKVAAGHQPGEGLPGFPRALYKQTFHPSFTDVEKATIVEVKEGSESSNIDIVMSRPVTSFKIIGRVIDGETEKPLANIQFGVNRQTEYGSSSTEGGMATNAAGEFKLDGVTPGKYSIYLIPQSNVRAEPLSFEVTDHDLKDLLIKTTKGGSLSGVVVLEGSEDKVLRPGFPQLMIYARVEDPTWRFHRQPQITEDGKFKLAGLSGGKIHLELAEITRKPGAPHYRIARVERNGVPQPDGIELKDGEDITGLRLVVKEMNGKIRGVVKVEKGEPDFVHVQLNLVSIADDPMKSVTRSVSSSQVDSRGHFLIEGLAPGTYVIHVTALRTGGRNLLEGKQQVTVTNNTVTEVTVTLSSN
jgi:protocatechuate 3,4-dioxygenase beta subunit